MGYRPILRGESGEVNALTERFLACAREVELSIGQARGARFIRSLLAHIVVLDRGFAHSELLLANAYHGDQFTGRENVEALQDAVRDDPEFLNKVPPLPTPGNIDPARLSHLANQVETLLVITSMVDGSQCPIEQEAIARYVAKMRSAFGLSS